MQLNRVPVECSTQAPSTHLHRPQVHARKCMPFVACVSSGSLLPRMVHSWLAYPTLLRIRVDIFT